MAIKIINPGKDNFIMHCKRCGCDFSYELTDVLLRVDFDFGYGVYPFIECPHCKSECDVKLNNQ